jgi:hypothetical protein
MITLNQVPEPFDTQHPWQSGSGFAQLIVGHNRNVRSQHRFRKTSSCVWPELRRIWPQQYLSLQNVNTPQQFAEKVVLIKSHDLSG